MADPDAPWMLDDDAPIDFSGIGDGGNEEYGGDESQETVNEAPVEAPKPPAEWRKTYKLAVST